MVELFVSLVILGSGVYFFLGADLVIVLAGTSLPAAVVLVVVNVLLFLLGFSLGRRRGRQKARLFT